MKYLVLVWDDIQGDGWMMFWYGKNKKDAKLFYRDACKEYPEVKLVSIVEMQGKMR